MAEPMGPLPRAIVTLINANERMRVNLEANAVVLKQALLLVRDGTDISDALFLLPTGSQRAASENSLDALLRARDGLRSALVTTALDAGMSVDDLVERLELTPEQVRAIAGQPSTDR